MDEKIIFRGFYENKNGTKTITINGAQIKGEWVYWNVFGKLTTSNGKVQRYERKMGDASKWYYDSAEQLPIRKETIGRYIGLTDENLDKIFTGDKFVPYYVTPMGERTNELDYYNKGIVKAGTAEYILVGGNIPDVPMNMFVETKISHYQPNYGEVHKYKDNIAHGEIAGNIFEVGYIVEENKQ